jgi:hypothetical protein
MQLRKISIVMLALLLAAMAMVPMVSAANIRPSQEIAGMKYFQDTISPTGNAVGIDKSTVSEYALVTVDSKGFMKDADTTHMTSFSIGGKEYRIQLEEVPVPLDKNAKLIVRTEKGISIQDIPKIKQYRGKIIGGDTGERLFYR